MSKGFPNQSIIPLKLPYVGISRLANFVGTHQMRAEHQHVKKHQQSKQCELVLPNLVLPHGAMGQLGHMDGLARCHKRPLSHIAQPRIATQGKYGVSLCFLSWVLLVKSGVSLCYVCF